MYSHVRFTGEIAEAPLGAGRANMAMIKMGVKSIEFLSFADTDGDPANSAAAEGVPGAVLRNAAIFRGRRPIQVIDFELRDSLFPRGRTQNLLQAVRRIT